MDVYNGTELRYYDSELSLLPYTYYEYRVWADNSAGSVSSQWSRVLTYQDVPAGIQTPQAVVCSLNLLYHCVSVFFSDFFVLYAHIPVALQWLVHHNYDHLVTTI